MTQSVLVLGTNAGQADLIRHMKQRGWRVIGCSPIPGELGQAWCDIVEPVDIVDLDALEDAARRHSVDLVYSISSDIAMKSVVALCERMGMRHFYDSAFVDMLDDKAALREYLAQNGLGAVPYIQVRNSAQAVGWSQFPCMVKPTDAQGQRGVQRVDEPPQLADAITRAVGHSRSGRAIVEGFLDGIELSCNVLVCGGEPRIAILSERLVHGPEAVGIPKGHLIPVRHVDARGQRAAMELVNGFLGATGHRDGVLYFQMIITPDGPRMVEIAPRLDGCHMWRLIHASHGVDLLASTIDCLLGQGVRESAHGEHPRQAMELMFQQMPPGQPFSASAFPVPTDARYHEYRYAEGEVVRPVNGSLEVVGYYVRPVS